MKKLLTRIREITCLADDVEITMEANPGESYSYQGGLLMEEFYSKELDRTFEKVLFVDALFEGTSIQGQQQQASQALPEVDYENMVTIERSDVEVDAGQGTVTIADLYADIDKFLMG